MPINETITKLKNGRVSELSAARLIMEEAVKGVVAVARAKDIQLPCCDSFGRILEVRRGMAGNIAPTLQDVLKERDTEVDFISGAIVREAEAAGIPTLMNLPLTSLVKPHQQAYQGKIQSLNFEICS